MRRNIFENKTDMIDYVCVFVIVLYGLGYMVETRIVHKTVYRRGSVHADIVHPAMATEQVYRFVNTMDKHIP